ncbi:MAG: SUMF1/EgtB/PvdO family nonheme iron enzyme [Simkaniaceae bacterium]
MEKRLLGDYNLIKQIGGGPLGSVYLAEHRFIKKHFAIKVLPEELAGDRNFIKRFEKEVKCLAALDHPHLVKIHNISFADGVYFLVADCIVDSLGETTNLAQYLIHRREPLSEEEIKGILYQIASALDYAHQKQADGRPLVHRGIKLNNILIGHDNQGMHVFLSDFGLNYIVGERTVLTRTYKVLANALSVNIGSAYFDRMEPYPAEAGDSNMLAKLHQSFLQNFAFLAPEQKMIKYDSEIGPAADVYAFGILTYYLLMGTFPEGFFPLPSTAYPHYQYNWDHLLYRCLQVNARKRPKSLKDALDESLELDELPRIIQRQMDQWKGKYKPETPVKNSAPDLVPSSPITGKTEEKHPEDMLYKEFAAAAPAPVKKMTANEIQKSETGSAAADYQTKEMSAPEKIEPALKKPKPILKPQEIERPTYEPDPGAIFHTEATVARYIPKEKEIKEIEPILTDMIPIKGGEFYRGSNEGGRDERPMHKIILQSFALDIHPVTNEQFVRFLESMGGEKDSTNNDIIRLRESRIKRTGGKYIIESGYSRHPVVGVTWYGAVAYAKWVGKRLPTEAEWEVASLGGLFEAIYPTGQNIERSQANYFSADTTAVMSYPPNGYGIYDMAGNVYEWCQDWYDYNYYETSLQEPENPKGPIQGVYRVLRGGCWKSLKEDLRCSHRHRNNPGTVNKTYGFRCAADAL